jgi:hypothetical protein
MVTDDKQYEHVSQQVRHHNDRILGSFDLFIRLFSAVVAGAIWLLCRRVLPVGVHITRYSLTFS